MRERKRNRKREREERARERNIERERGGPSGLIPSSPRSTAQESCGRVRDYGE